MRIPYTASSELVQSRLPWRRLTAWRKATPIRLSPRGAIASSSLAARFHDVTVCADNQAVVDSSDVIIACVRPEEAKAVLALLRFRSGQTVVNAIAGLRSSSLRQLLPRQRSQRILDILYLVDWLATRGIDRATADAYVAGVFAGLDLTSAYARSLRDLAAHHATPGGINEAFERHLEAAGYPTAVRTGLDRVLARLIAK